MNLAPWKRPPSREVLTLAVLASLWPIWLWLPARLGSSHPYEPWGWLLALATFLVLARRHRRSIPRPPSLGSIVWVFAYALGFPWLAPLPRAILGVGALGSLVSSCWLGGESSLASWGLLALSLRITPALQGYFGVPLRELVAILTGAALRALGIPVERLGVLLLEGGHEVLVDVPCSGLRMLWAGLFLVFTLAWSWHLGSRRTLLALVLAFPVLILGNVLRSLLLFLAETGRMPLPAGGHTLVGALIYLVTAAGLILVLRRLRPGTSPETSDRDRNEPPTFPGRSWALLLACLVAATVPFYPALLGAEEPDLRAFPGWPRSLHGRGLEPAPLAAAERELEAQLPGRFACFTDGTRRIHLAWLVRPTSLLHARATCARAWGFEVRPQPDWVDPDGHRWGSLLASREGQRVWIRERLVDARGEAFTDLYSWYLAALLGRSQGPWSYTTMQEVME